MEIAPREKVFFVLQLLPSLIKYVHYDLISNYDIGIFFWQYSTLSTRRVKTLLKYIEIKQNKISPGWNGKDGDPSRTQLTWVVAHIMIFWKIYFFRVSWVLDEFVNILTKYVQCTLPLDYVESSCPGYERFIILTKMKSFIPGVSFLWHHNSTLCSSVIEESWFCSSQGWFEACTQPMREVVTK